MKVTAWLRAFVMFLGVVSVAQGGIYYVSPNGDDNNSGSSANSPWRTLNKANRAATAGDVVIIFGGQYNEGIHPANSGRAGSPITFQSASGERVMLVAATGIQLDAANQHVVIDGFEVHASYRVAELIGCSYITVRNCTLYGGWGTYQTFALNQASYCVIQNNYIDRQGPDGDTGSGNGLDLQAGSHHNLIEGNTVTRCQHVGFSFGISGKTYNIWRNNHAFNNHTNYALFNGVERTVFEGNTGYYQGLVWTGGSGNCLQFTGTNCIIRFNTLYDDTATAYPLRQWPAVVGAGSGSSQGDLVTSMQYNKIYNNTVYGENDQKEWQKNCWRTENYLTGEVQNENVFKNNIFAGAPGDQVVDIDDAAPSSQMNNRYDGNLLYGANGQGATVRYYFSGGNNQYTLSQAKASRSAQWGPANKEGNPLFVNTVGQGPGKDFSLREGSPAIDGGVHLAVATNGGNGSLTLTVDDAGYFCDGWGIPGVEGDSIKIEAESPVGISQADYVTNTVTLNSPRSWNAGARVFHFRSDHFQGNAPDIGAHESGWEVTIPPPSRPLTPSLFLPEDGAVNIDPNVTLQWNQIGSAQVYRVQLSTDASFTTRQIDVTTANPFLSVSPLSPAATYYWRVNASNSAGTSDWSGVWSLTTADPGNPSVNVVSNPAFDNDLDSWWSYSNGQAEFLLASPGYTDDHAGKLRIIAAGDNTQIFQYNISLKPNTTYSLRFAAYSTTGHDLDVTVAKHGPPYTSYGLSAANFDLGTGWKVFTTEFTTANFTSQVNDARLRLWIAPYASEGDEYYIDNVVLAPVTNLLAPMLVAPAPRATDQPVDVTLRWLKVEGASAYGIEVALDSSFTQGVMWDTTVVDTQYHLSSLSSLTTYYWRVKSRNEAGAGTFSSVSSFTTGSASLFAPAITEPSNLGGPVPLELTLAWSTVPGATRYRVQLATDPSFSVLVVNDSTIADTVVHLGPLQDAATYYLRVRAENSIACGQYSSPLTLTTSAGQLAIPFLVVLPGQSSSRPVVTSITWLSVPGAVRYHLQLATDLQFTALVRDDSTLTDTVAQLGPLSYGTTYFVRVRAMNDRVASPFSLPYGFSTIPAAPPAPAGIALASQPEQTKVRLSWLAIPGALRYHLQVSKDSLFSSVLVNDSSLTDTIRSVTSLNSATRYFARVRATGNGGMGPYSMIFGFTTAGLPPSPNAPPDYLLEQNYPNPFNPATKIRYGLPADLHVRIIVFNSLGQRVKTLVDADQVAGNYELELFRGQLASGTYFYMFEAGAFVQTRRLLILK